MPAVVRTMSLVRQQYPYGTDDADRVRQFIRDAYSRWGTKWVLIGGDVDVIPVRYGTTTFYGGEQIATDVYYQCLDGNWNADGDSYYGEGYYDATDPGDAADLFPEVWVGRAPVSTRADAQLFVNKTLQYTKTPVGDYENSVLYFAEVLFPQVWNPGDFVSLDGAQLAEETLPYLRSHPGVRYTRLYENHTDSRWEPGSLPENRQTVIDSLNRGYNVSVHIGHGYRNVMAVGFDQNLVNADALALSNGSRLTNLYSINCTSQRDRLPVHRRGVHAGPERGLGHERRLDAARLPVGRPGVPEGILQARLPGQRHRGRARRSRARSTRSSGIPPADNVNRWMQMTLILLGDPELRLYTALPRTLSVVHPGSIFVSDSTIAVSVNIGGTPLAGARVVAYKPGDEYRIATTDAAGAVVLPFRPDSLGAVTLTVTAFNARPYQATIAIDAAIQPVLSDRVPVLDDDSVGGSSGNGNGLMDSGETIDIRIQVKNTGSSTATSVVGTLSTSDPNATVTQATVSYGSISAGATTSVAGAYRVTIPAAAPDDREITFNLRLADAAGRTWNESVPIVNHAPVYRLTGYQVLDAGGNAERPSGPGRNGPVPCPHPQRRHRRGLERDREAAVVERARQRARQHRDVGLRSLPGRRSRRTRWCSFPRARRRSSSCASRTRAGCSSRASSTSAHPASPTDLTGLGSTSSIVLRWTNSTVPDLLGYNVYRSASAAGPFARMTAIPTERTAYYVDEGLATLTRYYYKVSAVDSSANESDLSEVVPVSTNPPTHAYFPLPIATPSKSSVAVEHIWAGYPLSIVSGSGDVLYAWNHDGTAPVDADGTIATSGDFTVRGRNYVAPPSVADLDGDGYMDIVASSWDSLRTYAFNRNGQVRAGWPVVTPDAVWSAAAIADLDNDGKPEIVFGSNGLNVYAFRWNGVEVRDGDANPATNGVFKRLDTAYNFGTPAIADIDGDGRREVVIASENGWIHALRSDGTKPAGWPVYLGSSGAHIYGSSAIGNLDGAADSELDIVIPIEKDGGLDSIHVLRANGQKKPGWPRPASIGGMDLAPSPALADMNNDGKLDVVYAGTDGRLYVYHGTGAPLAPLDGVRFSTLTYFATESSPIVADINGDGMNDIVIGDELGFLTAISGDGTVLPGFPILLGAEVKGTPALCDCDADGKTEIVFSGMDLKVHVWDYDFPFSPSLPVPWPQFHHDAARTGYAGQAGMDGGRRCARLPRRARGRVRAAVAESVARRDAGSVGDSVGPRRGAVRGLGVRPVGSPRARARPRDRECRAALGRVGPARREPGTRRCGRVLRPAVARTHEPGRTSWS